MKHLKRLTALLLSAIVLLNAGLALAIQDGFRTTYTYNYDYWGDIAESPDAYRVQQVIYSSSLGLETPMRRPQSLYVRGQEIYVCDTGNNRILQLKRDRKPSTRPGTSSRMRKAMSTSAIPTTTAC